MTDDIITTIEGKAGRLRLNRPEALNALTSAMCEAITAQLHEWRDDPGVEAVLIDHAEGRGFCAGGDIRMLAESGATDGVKARAFFHTEYRMNHLLFTFMKPSAAFMDGITMGGGVGLSQPCKYRIATENTRFAMPETGIGLFPDVGAGWYLSRLPGRTGQFLALTGARLNGAECKALGLATHYVPSERSIRSKPRSPTIRTISPRRFTRPRPKRPRRGSSRTATRSTGCSPRTVRGYPRRAQSRWRRLGDKGARNAAEQIAANLQGRARTAPPGQTPDRFRQRDARRISRRQPCRPAP